MRLQFLLLALTALFSSLILAGPAPLSGRDQKVAVAFGRQQEVAQAKINNAKDSKSDAATYVRLSAFREVMRRREKESEMRSGGCGSFVKQGRRSLGERP
jgi:hypothetical protein